MALIPSAGTVDRVRGPRSREDRSCLDSLVKYKIRYNDTIKKFNTSTQWLDRNIVNISICFRDMVLDLRIDILNFRKLL